jgi:hypothetical protein
MPWRLDLVSGLVAGLLFVALARSLGASLPTSLLEGTAFAAAWLITGLFLRRRAKRR